MNLIKKYSWILVPLIAIGGIFYPILGIVVLFIMLALMIVGMVNGRYWCGNLCPHGILFDNLIDKISFSNKIPSLFKSLYFKWGFFVFFMGMFILRFIRVLNARGTEEFLNNFGFLFVLQYLIMPTIVGISLSYFISSRAWCSFCPMGTLAEIMYKLGRKTGLNLFNQKVNIINPEKCEKCGACAQTCPLELVPYQNFNTNNNFDNMECMKCGKCINNCPPEILELNKKNQKTSQAIKKNI